jgi:hypothetical protein
LSFVSILPSVKKNAKLLDTRPEQAGIDDFEPASIFIVGSDAHAARRALQGEQLDGMQPARLS